MIYKCTGYKKFGYKDKKTFVNKSAIIFYGLRPFTPNELNNSESEGYAVEEKFISEASFPSIPDGVFKVGKFYSFKTISDGYTLSQIIEEVKDFQ